jgi:hypothetical protein
MTTQRCETCYGEGAVITESGPSTCSDCHGIGTLPSAPTLAERRLREIEERFASQGGEQWRDVRWLVAEVRRGHHALLQILAASQDAVDGDGVPAKIRFLANDVLGVYPAVTQREPG